MTFVTFTILLLSFFSVSEQTEEVCLPVRRDSNVEVPTPEVRQQGRPGKVGPTGLPGPQGAQGPPGECLCDVTEMEAFRSDVLYLKEQNAILRKVPNLRIPLCSVGVSVRDGRVRDEDMTSSSFWSGSFRARAGRLDEPSVFVWVAGENKARKGEWIQVDLKQPTRVIGVVTQGRPERHQFVAAYKIMTGNSEDNLQFITNTNGKEIIFQGNRDSNSYVINAFPRPLVARFLRLVVDTWRGYISMRLDYLTC